MIDITSLDISWRGYPVTLMSTGVAGIIDYAEGDGVPGRLLGVLKNATDTAGPGEPAGWIFESTAAGHEVWIERFGGYRDDSGHHGGQWSIYLPSER